jgi:hypothetical protein
MTLILCACAGVAFADVPPAPVEPPSTDTTKDATKAAPAVSSQEYLAWGITGEGALTAWVKAYDDGRVEVVATTPKIMVAGGGGVWSFVDVRTPSKLLDCECIFEKPDADPEKGDCQTTGEVNQFRLVDALSGRVLKDYGMASMDGNNSDYGFLETWAGFVGSAEQVAFVSSTTDGFACGAHGSVSYSFSAIDLVTGKVIAEDTQMEALQKEVEDLRAKAAVEFKANAEETMLEPEEDPAKEGGALTMVYPIYPSADAAPMWRYQFTRDACYACSDGRWNSYSVSAWVEADKPPKGLVSKLSAPPAAIQKAWAEVKINDSSRGWTALTLDDAAKAKLLAAMKAP